MLYPINAWLSNQLHHYFKSVRCHGAHGGGSSVVLSSHKAYGVGKTKSCDWLLCSSSLQVSLDWRFQDFLRKTEFCAACVLAGWVLYLCVCESDQPLTDFIAIFCYFPSVYLHFHTVSLPLMK